MNILLAGEGGQGVQTVAKIITKSAAGAGKFVTYLPSFGVEQRGGVSLAYIIISDKKIGYPRFQIADLVGAFSNRSIDSIKKYLGKESLLIYDNSIILENTLLKIRDQVDKFKKIPAQKIAQEKFSVKSSNMLMLGAISTQIEDLNQEELENQIFEEFKEKIAKNPEIKDLNLDAFREGINIAKGAQDNIISGEVEKPLENEFEKDNKKWLRFPQYCKGCSLCIVRCPVKAIKFSEDLGFLNNPLPEVDIDKCIACGKCMEICPDAAIKVEKISSQQVE